MISFQVLAAVALHHRERADALQEGHDDLRFGAFARGLAVFFGLKIVGVASAASVLELKTSSFLHVVEIPAIDPLL